MADERKRWYRHQKTGQLGYVVLNDNGEDEIRIDNAAMDIRRPLNDEWEPEAELPPLNEAAIKRIAFEADKELCRSVGLHKEGRREWIGLTDSERIGWVRNGPPKSETQVGTLRRILFECITEELRFALK